jgi:putative Mn2+ efflux pump MntP
MGFFELILLAIGLSMDAMAVALCKGLAQKNSGQRQGFALSGYFALFQAVMPLLGFLLGCQFEQYIAAFDHWIVFILLSLIGGKMIYGFARGDSCRLDQDQRCTTSELLLLAAATSVDALAAGVMLAFLQVQILPAILLIGLVTFILSLGGYLAGGRLGLRFGSYAELAGGVVLILIGSKILLEHLEVF